MTKEALQDIPAIAREESMANPSTQPGRILRAARERQSLTPPDIAARLNLDVRIILALEEDRYDDLRVPAYVRGYLRSYGRLLGVSPEELIRAYDRVADQAPPLHPFKSRPAAQADTSHNVVQGVTALVVVLVLAMTLAWWWTREQPNPLPTGEGPTAEVPAPEAPVAGAVTASDGEQYRFPIVSHEAAGAATSPVAVDPNQDFTPPNEQAEDPAPNGAEVGSDVALAAAPDAGELDTADTSAAASVAAATTEAPNTDAQNAEALTADSSVDNEASDADAASPSADASTALPPSADGLRNLTLNLSGKAWVEIYDADNKRLFFNMGKPGQNIATRGKPPLKVTIGNTEVASLSVDGVPVDLAALAVEGVARVQVNSDSIERAQRRLED